MRDVGIENIFGSRHRIFALFDDVVALRAFRFDCVRNALYYRGLESVIHAVFKLRNLINFDCFCCDDAIEFFLKIRTIGGRQAEIDVERMEQILTNE